MPESHEPFEGFDPPFYTQVPDAIFDRFLNVLSGAELKVILYICRRTFGFKKTDDDISISQLMHGITKKNGEVLDHGTGLSRDSVTRATKTLEERGLIVRTRNASETKGDQATTYKLKMREGGVRKSDTGVSENRTGPVRSSDPQETVRQETDEEPFEFEAYFDDFRREFRDSAPRSSTMTRARRLYEESGLDPDTFRDHLYEARSRTKNATNVKSRTAYFFRVLEELCRGSSSAGG